MERKEKTAYDVQAETFLQRSGIAFVAAFKGDKCPPWCDGQCVHGDHYRVTLRRTDKRKCPRSVSFDFWNSQADMQAGKRPTAYDVLSCISSEVGCPDTFEDFCGEYGEEPDSHGALATFKRLRAFADKLQAFFVQDEIDDLGNIQ